MILIVLGVLMASYFSNNIEKVSITPVERSISKENSISRGANIFSSLKLIIITIVTPVAMFFIGFEDELYNTFHPVGRGKVIALAGSINLNYLKEGNKMKTKIETIKNEINTYFDKTSENELTIWIEYTWDQIYGYVFTKDSNMVKELSKDYWHLADEKIDLQLEKLIRYDYDYLLEELFIRSDGFIRME